MRIKTFYSKTISEALKEIKEHLGPDALILSTKEVQSRSGIWGRSSGFEVVAATDGPDNLELSPSAWNRAEGGGIHLSAVATEDNAQTKEMMRTYSASSWINKPAGRHLLPENDERAEPATKPEPAPHEDSQYKGRVPLILYRDLYRDLLSSGVDGSLARDLLSRAHENLAEGQQRNSAAVMQAAAQAVLSLVAPPLNPDGLPGKKVVAFVGPTGVGKTTSIAKLAAHLALQKQKKLILMTLDGYRIGAIEQLRTYAGLMGIPFRFVDRASELSRAIEENSQRDYILIDTAGRAPRDLDAMDGLATILRDLRDIETHLVLSATTKESDMRRIMDQFEICRPDHLLFTKLDETSTPGPILNELVRTRKSFSYYTDGQRVPDDLHPLPRERILEIVLHRNDNAPKE
jgi:flagellar biosynthesis protein FlhF